MNNYDPKIKLCKNDNHYIVWLLVVFPGVITSKCKHVWNAFQRYVFILNIYWKLLLHSQIIKSSKNAQHQIIIKLVLISTVILNDQPLPTAFSIFTGILHLWPDNGIFIHFSTSEFKVNSSQIATINQFWCVCMTCSAHCLQFYIYTSLAQNKTM